MKLRLSILSLIAFGLLAAGCGGSDGDSNKKDSKKSDTKTKTTASKAADKTPAVPTAKEDRENKKSQVSDAKKAFSDKPKDIGACRNLAMAYVALASPASSPDPKKPAPLPKDRDKNLGKSIDTLEKCVDINKGDRDVQQMLASTYMATNKFEKATPLLASLARTAKGAERANAYYAWGLAASNAQQYKDAIAAWTVFINAAPPKDPRVAQVRSSITALRAAAKNPPKAATAAPSGDDGAADPNTNDKGGNDAPEDGGSADDKGSDNK
ncbi:MAG: hypothetical protein JWM98_240 [Thermoleophilia bacterium]|nr:hypothetical protein [Thermoleophilia bacterium]